MNAITVENHGTIYLFRPENEDALVWLEENTQDDALWFGGALCVEPRYVAALADGAREEGFEIYEQ